MSMESLPTWARGRKALFERRQPDRRPGETPEAALQRGEGDF